MMYGDWAAACAIITGSCTPYRSPSITGVMQMSEHAYVKFAQYLGTRVVYFAMLSRLCVNIAGVYNI